MELSCALDRFSNFVLINSSNPLPNLDSISDKVCCVQIGPEVKPGKGIYKCFSMEFALGVLHNRL